ncbi:MAG: F0F1 ATP synthase subunit alpha, partial [Patescibacteria group bacterium]
MNKNYIIDLIKQQIQDYQHDLKVEKVGTVVEVGDGIAKISGLSDAMASEMLDFGNDVFGVALNLDEDFIGAIILGDYGRIRE